MRDSLKDLGCEDLWLWSPMFALEARLLRIAINCVE